MLDDPDAYPVTDPTNLRQRLQGFPLQCEAAWKQALTFDLPAGYGLVERVLLLGMGGSAIGGDLVADLASLENSPPIEVHRDYDLPPYVGPNTLVFACSFSGNTAETLSSFRRALTKGAKIVAVTSGGILGEEAGARGVPLVQVKYQGEPRTALGYSFLVPLGLLAKLGLLTDKASEMSDALHSLKRLVGILDVGSPTEANPAKQLASQVHGRLLIIYGGGIFKGVARRWKTQLNENAKMWAFSELLPEAHHNSVVGFMQPSSIKGLAFVLLLRPEPLHPSVALRYSVTEEVLQLEGVAYRTIDGIGDTPLSQVLNTVLLGDYTSYYLAVLQGVDPSPVPAVDFVKKRMMG